MANYQVTLQRSGRVIQVNDQTSLLNSLKQQLIPLEYQCQQGYCGACRTQLLQGQVRDTALPLAYKKANEILPCCCIPKSELLLAL